MMGACVREHRPMRFGMVGFLMNILVWSACICKVLTILLALSCNQVAMAEKLLKDSSFRITHS